jgi:hypothetical protein
MAITNEKFFSTIHQFKELLENYFSWFEKMQFSKAAEVSKTRSVHLHEKSKIFMILITYSEFFSFVFLVYKMDFNQILFCIERSNTLVLSFAFTSSACKM